MLQLVKWQESLFGSEGHLSSFSGAAAVGILGVLSMCVCVCVLVYFVGSLVGFADCWTILKAPTLLVGY